MWKPQPWYPKLLEMLTDFPLKIAMQEDIVSQTSRPAVVPQLAVWNISGVDSKMSISEEGTELLLASCRQSLHNLTTHSFESGYAGMTNGILIPFQVL